MTNLEIAKAKGHYVFCRFLVRNGLRIYPKKSRVFRFWVND